jgi:DNA processing protein
MQKNIFKTVPFHIDDLNSMKKYPKELFYIGNLDLLKRTKISIVGSRSPNQYSRYTIAQIANKLSQVGVCIVSGGAMGIDAIAHKNAGASNTIMVAGTGLDKRYPAVNKTLIQSIEEQGLVLSQFQAGVSSKKWNFPLRNELVVALGDVLVVAHADINSGTIRSVEYALKMGKPIYVLPHRIGDSDGTNKLLANGDAKAIYDIDEFVSLFGDICSNDTQDQFLQYCKNNPLYDDVVLKYGDKVFEYELLDKISIKDGKIYIKQ